ncbi:MAG: hypothetical protein JST00_22005 [Deltaproteobacteria bacterium]|nr:hypothetical protein [Deltaproteobacteria bacterium]
MRRWPGVALVCVTLAACNAHGGFRIVDDTPMAPGLARYRAVSVEVTADESALKATPADERFLANDLEDRLRKEAIFAEVRAPSSAADVKVRVAITTLGWARAQGISSDTPAEAKVIVNVVDTKTQKSLGTFGVHAKRGGLSPESDDNRALHEAMQNAARGIVERLRRQR